MLKRVMSGGQTGADQAAWRAARAAGIPTGGRMPKGFLTEDGPRPDFAGLYGAQELASPDYDVRTRRNVRDSNGTLWFDRTDSPGARCTLEACQSYRRPFLVVSTTEDRGENRAAEVADWILEHGITLLNVAGNRESRDQDIGARVEAFLGLVFAALARRTASHQTGQDRVS